MKIESMGYPQQAGKSVLVIVEKLLTVLLVIALVAELFVMFGNVILRSIFHESLVWSTELGQLALITITFLGGAVAYPKGEHLSIKAVIDFLPKWTRPYFDAFENWMVLMISVIIGYVAIKTGIEHMDETTMSLGINVGWFSVPIVLGQFFLAYFALERLRSLPRRNVLIITVFVVLVSAIVLSTFPIWSPLFSNAGILTLTLISLFVLLLIGVPIGFVLQCAAVIYLNFNPSVSLTIVPMMMQHGISSFVMLAIPFFIMVGYIMTEGGISRRLTEFIMAVVGRVRGGLLHVIVVVMYVVSGLSGSKVADVAAVGTTMNKVLREHGYDPGESAAVLAAAAVMGETIPPSIAMLVLGAITTLSIGTLFIAGLLPAVVMAICIMVLITIRAYAKKMRVEKGVGIKVVGKKFLSSIPAFLAPLILIAGIVGGIATPTEVSSTVVIYALILSTVFYREMSPAKLWKTLADSASKTGMVLLIIASASAFSWTLTVAQVPLKIAMFMTTLHGSPTYFMLVSIIVLIITGAILEGLPALIIFGPLLLPFAPQFGVNPIQYGMIMVICNGIGAFLPPIGMGAYVCCSVCETSIESITHKILPYLIFLIIGTLLIAFVPWFTLVIPRMFHFVI